MTITEKQKDSIIEAIEHLKETAMDNSETLFEKNLKVINLQRIIDINERNEVFCSLKNGYIQNLFKCHIGCPFGHMTECHFPFTCSSQYCKHYKEEKKKNPKLGECCDSMRQSIENKFLTIKNNEIVFNIPKFPEKSYNVLTGEVYDPANYPISFTLLYCPFCTEKLIKIEEEIYDDASI